MSCQGSEPKSFLEKGKHKNGSGVSGERLPIISAQRGGGCGRKDLIPEHGKSKYLHPCPPFLWRACSPDCQE